MAHPVPNKGFRQLSPEAAMLLATLWVHHPPSPVLPFWWHRTSKKTLCQVTSQEWCIMRLSHIP